MNEIITPAYCETCGHFHFADGDCPDRDSDCGSFLCCNGMNDDNAPCCEGTAGCTSTHIFDNDECEV
jgi:hypothetical protein